MPVSVVTDEQQRRYGHYVGDLTADQLAHDFHLDDADCELIMRRRGDHNRLGFALQLGTVRYLGTFLENPIETPPGVVASVARQLGIADLAGFAQYCAGEQRWEHAAEIHHRYGYRDFASGAVRWRLNRWLYALCWSGTDRPSLLFDQATTWLLMHKVILPGVSVLERSVARVRTRVHERLWRVLIRGLTPERRAQLDTLLHVPEGQRRSTLDRLRTGPTLRSAPELVRALRLLEEVRTLGLGVSVPARAPRGRVLELARFAATAKVSAIERLAPERRMATLVAFVHTLEATAQDDALDLLEVLLTEIFSKAEALGRKARLRTLKDLDAAALQTSAGTARDTCQHRTQATACCVFPLQRQRQFALC
jgi:Domain of unknown function (DUF4158)